jgi:hypothetical protein
MVNPYVYVGASPAPGPPVQGTYVAGNWVTDGQGVNWVCVTGGTPGTWDPAYNGLSMPLPTGAPAAGNVPVATGVGEASAWGTVSGGGGGGGLSLAQMAVQTANFTVAANSSAPCSLSGGSLTATLPAAPANGTVISVFVSAVSGVGVNALTVAAGGSDVFDIAGGSTTMTLTLLHQTLTWVYDNGVWAKIASSDPYLQVASSRLGVYYLDQYAGTDDQKFASALAAVIAAGSGTIQLSPRAHNFALPWATTYVPGTAHAIRISGGGGPPHGMSEGVPSAATTCNLSYAGSGAARMNFQHAGSIEIDHIKFADSGGSAVPFFQTTNAQPYLHDNYFVGQIPYLGAACFQDAIYMGGLSTSIGAGDNAPFQGYEGTVERCSFYGIRVCGWARTYANNVVFRDCLVDGSSCGSPNLFSSSDAAMTAGSAVLTCATSAPFTSAMVGQMVLVAGAGVVLANGWLAGVITAYTSPTQVTLSSTAITTVSAAQATAPAAAPFIFGTYGSGVEGSVLEDCCIETNAYAVGTILYSSTGNKIDVSYWDGGAGTLGGLACVGASKYNIISIPYLNLTGTPFQVVSDTYPGQEVYFANSDTNPGRGNAVPNLEVDGGALRVIGPGSSTGTRLGFGAIGQADDTWIYRDGNGNLVLYPGYGTGTPYYDLRYSTLGAKIGNLANYAYVGPEGTIDVFYGAGGTNTNISTHVGAQGTGTVKLASKLAATFVAIPVPTVLTAAGSGATASIVGNDQRGTITVTTGTGPTAGNLVSVAFTTTGGTYPGVPTVIVAGYTAAPAALQPYVVSESATAFVLSVIGTPAASTAYTFSYIVMG